MNRFAQKQEDLKNELRADIEVKIMACKKFTKELDLRENLLLDLMEFKDWDLTKQFAVARSKVTNRASTASSQGSNGRKESRVGPSALCTDEKDEDTDLRTSTCIW